MKATGTNAFVRNAWGAQSQASARTPNGNLWFEGRTLYSYRTPIAKFHDGVALVTTQTYSVTTSGKHMPRGWEIKGAYFYVPNIGANGEATHAMHAENLAHYEAQYAETRDALLKATRLSRYAHNDVDQIAQRLREHVNEAKAYCAAFGFESIWAHRVDELCLNAEASTLLELDARAIVARFQKLHNAHEAKQNPLYCVVKQGLRERRQCSV